MNLDNPIPDIELASHIAEEAHAFAALCDDYFLPRNPHISVRKTAYNLMTTAMQRVFENEQSQLIDQNQELRERIKRLEDAAVRRESRCCDNEKRNINGGCDNCGDPSY